MNTLAISSWSLHRHMPRARFTPAAYAVSVDKFPQLARDTYGVDAVEICQMHLESPKYGYLDKLNKALAGAAVRVVNVPIDVGNISQSDPAGRAADIETIKSWIKAAAYLGSPAVRVNAGKPDSGSWNLDVTIESYRELVHFGKKLNVRVLIENHGGISSDPITVLRIVRAVNAFYFMRLCPDFGNFDPYQRYDGLRMMMPSAYIVHAKTLDFDERGEHTAFDFGECMRVVRQARFPGPLSVEFEGDEDEFEGIQKSLDLIRRHLAAPVAAAS